MGAARPRRWKLPFHRTVSAVGGGGGAPCSPSSRSSSSPARSEAWAAEAVPEEFLCPISGALMADPVILPSGKTFERACLQACAELAFLPPGAEAGGLRTVIPNAALKAAIGTWCARSGRAGPPPPPLSAEAARQAVLRAMPPAAARTTARRVAAVMAASTSNSSTSSYGSASEITAAEDEAKEAEAEAPADPMEDDVVGKVMRADDGGGGVVAAAMGALREATREGAERRLALCTRQCDAPAGSKARARGSGTGEAARAAWRLGGMSHDPPSAAGLQRSGGSAGRRDGAGGWRLGALGARLNAAGAGGRGEPRGGGGDGSEVKPLEQEAAALLDGGGLGDPDIVRGGGGACCYGSGGR